VGGGFSQREGGHAVTVANGGACGDVGAVLGRDVAGLASAGGMGEGRVEREGFQSVRAWCL
jgi:hypothetical protein